MTPPENAATTPGQERRAEALTTSAPITTSQHDPGRVTSAATLSHAAWATPYSLKERQGDGLPPRAVMHVGYPYGKQMRMVAVELDRTALLKIIANAADALRLLDEAPDD